MSSKKFHFAAIFLALALIASCFIPWTYYPDIDVTFNGFNVERFATGNYYGKAGYAITVLSILILGLILVPKLWAKRVNIFVSALLFAYCLRTYIIFSSGLVEGDVEKKTGIYLVVLFSTLLMVSCVFPYMPSGKKKIKPYRDPENT